MRGIIVKETGRRIYDVRKQKGLSADTVAQRAGMHRATYYRYEAGDGKNMKLDKLQAIAEALGVHPSELVVWGEENEKPVPETEDELDEELVRLLVMLTPEETGKVIAFAQGLVAAREDVASPHA